MAALSSMLKENLFYAVSLTAVLYDTDSMYTWTHRAAHPILCTCAFIMSQYMSRTYPDNGEFRYRYRHGCTDN